MKNIGERLKEIREHSSLNQEKFSEKYGISRQALSRYETGNADISEELKISLIKDGYNINWLLTGDGVMFIEESSFETNTYQDMLPLLNKLGTLSKEEKEKVSNYIDELKR